MEHVGVKQGILNMILNVCPTKSELIVLMNVTLAHFMINSKKDAYRVLKDVSVVKVAMFVCSADHSSAMMWILNCALSFVVMERSLWWSVMMGITSKEMDVPLIAK